MPLLTPVNKLLSVLCLLLLAVLGLEWLSLNVRFSKTDLSIVPQVATEDTGQLLSGFVGLSEQDYTEMASQPLFVEGRMPVDTDETAVDQSGGKQFGDASFKVSLVGISLSDADSLALVLDNKRKYHRLLIGDELQGWTLKSIQQTSVVFSRGGSNKTLELEKHKATRNLNNNRRRLSQSRARVSPIKIQAPDQGSRR